MHGYDPDHAPDPSAWLQVDEQERLDSITRAHAKLAPDHPPVGKLSLHAAIHATVENQLAAGNPLETRLTLQRLVASGMTRHSAVHAIGTIVAEELSAVLKQHRQFDEAGYVRRLRALTREGYERGE